MPGLSGCLVVRNGKSSVVRCLDALLPIVNEYVIIDTGSTDGTKELITSWVNSHNGPHFVLESVGTRFHDDGVFDFGAAKNYAISKATCPYVMWVDVNDKVTRGREVRAAFEKIVRKIPHASISLLTKVDKSFSFPRIRIAPREFAHFEGSIHEYMTNTAPDGQCVTTRFEIENFKKYRDIARNTIALQKEWSKKHTQRCAFYLANSARDINDFEGALEWYKVTVDEFPNKTNEERAKSMEAICDIALRFNDMETLGEMTSQFISELPDRPEGFYYRAKYQYNMENYPMAVKSLKRLLDLNKRVRPTHMWINPAIYDRKTHMQMLREASVNAEYHNMQPLKPQCITDLNTFNANQARIAEFQNNFGFPGSVVSTNMNY